MGAGVACLSGSAPCDADNYGRFASQIHDVCYERGR